MEENSIKLQCPTCRQRLKIHAKSLAKSIVCPKCNGRFRITEQLKPKNVDRKELFGPPQSSMMSFEDSSADLFDDIDNVIESEALDRTEKPAPPRIEPAGSANTNASTVAEQWRNQKKVLSKSDESLNRNGTGLTILAFGLATVPMFASQVDSLQTYLGYLPPVAVGISFVAAFMLAYAKRRESVGAIILRCMPFCCVCFLAAVSFLFFVEPPPMQSLAGEKNEVEQPFPKDDQPLLDKSAVENNAAANFAPPHKKFDNELVPVAPNPVEADDNETENPLENENPLPKSSLKPSKIVVGGPVEHEPLETELQRGLALAKKVSENTDKIRVFKDRAINKLNRFLISKDRFVTGAEYGKKIGFSKCVGRETVYGTALFADEPIRGFDVGHMQGLEDNHFEFMVPIVGEPEFTDSFVVSQGSRFSGLRLNFDNQGIIGVQPIATTSDGLTKKGDWIGQSPTSAAGQIKTIMAKFNICGFVVYRDQFDTVGLRLIERRPQIN